MFRLSLGDIKSAKVHFLKVEGVEYRLFCNIFVIVIVIIIIIRIEPQIEQR